MRSPPELEIEGEMQLATARHSRLRHEFFPIENFSIEAGPQIGMLISAETDYDYNYTDYEFPEDNESMSSSEDAKDVYKSIDFGFNFGLGYKLNNGLNFSARYNLGLSGIDEERDLNNDDEEKKGFPFVDRKNNVIQVSVGYFF